MHHQYPTGHCRSIQSPIHFTINVNDVLQYEHIVVKCLVILRISLHTQYIRHTCSETALGAQVACGLLEWQITCSFVAQKKTNSQASKYDSNNQVKGYSSYNVRV